MTTQQSLLDAAVHTGDTCNRSSVRSTDGESLKQRHLESLRSNRAVYIRLAQRALLQRLLIEDTATADDVRDAVELPPGIDPTLFGAVPGPLVRSGIIEAAGFRKTSRPKAHARPVTVWQLVDRHKAELWLAANPNPAHEENPAVAAAGQE